MIAFIIGFFLGMAVFVVIADQLDLLNEKIE